MKAKVQIHKVPNWALFLIGLSAIALSPLGIGIIIVIRLLTSNSEVIGFELLWFVVGIIPFGLLLRRRKWAYVGVLAACAILNFAFSLTLRIG